MQGYLSLGSNLGDRLAYLKTAMELLESSGIKTNKYSSVYETVPLDVKDSQENYLNMVIQSLFDMGPFALLEKCMKIETDMGRQRPYFHSPRIIDIDILVIENIFINTEILTLPHPGIEKRGFIIWPLNEIAENLKLASGKTVNEIKKTLGQDEIVTVWRI